MAYQSEAALEQQFIEQLNKQEYSTVDIPDYDALVENFKVQFEAFNAPKLDTPITDKEWERIFNLMLGKSVFQSAKILRDKFVLEREDGTKVYLSFFDQDHTKNIFQVTHQTTVVGKYVNRYDVTILVNGLPLIQVELKRRGIDIREAVNQVMRYKKHFFIAAENRCKDRERRTPNILSGKNPVIHAATALYIKSCCSKPALALQHLSRTACCDAMYLSMLFITPTNCSCLI